MDEDIAKGYAAAFVRQQVDHSAIREWLESPRRSQAFKKFTLASQMEHEGRILETVAPLLCPPFGNPFVPASWNSFTKMVAAQLITAAPETEIFHASQSEILDFTEKSVFLNNIMYMNTAGKVNSSLMTVANICHHALTRLLQRRVSSEISLEYLVWISLAIARDLAQIFSLTSLDRESAFDFLIPFMGGALVARTMNVSPGIEQSYQGDRWVFSLRTFLEDGMLKASDQERMAGLSIEEDGTMRLRWLGQTREMQRGIMREADLNHIKGWLQANARPSRQKGSA